HVDADVTQATQLVAAGGELHEAVPVGQLNAIHRVGSVGVLGNLVVQPGATQGHAGGQVHAHTDSALVQVGFAARLTCRQAQHGHHRIAHQHDDANIRHAFVADALEDRVRGYAVLDQCAITVPAQRVKAGEDIGDLMLQFVVGDDLAGNRAIATFETVRDHQNAVAAGALGRLDDEVLMVLDDVLELLDILFGFDNPVHFRHVDAGRDGAFLGDDLVIDDRIQVPLVVLEHVVRV